VQHVWSEGDTVPSGHGLNTAEFLKITNQKEMHQTRRRLAMGLLLLLSIMALVPTIALVLGHWTYFTVAQFSQLDLVFTPVVALASAAFGFFFASDQRDQGR